MEQEQQASEDKVQQQPQPFISAHRFQKLLQWVKSHPFLTVSYVLGVIILVDIITLPYGDIRELRTKNPTETAFMRAHAQRAKEQGKPFRKKQKWVPLKAIAPDARDAVIVAEDGTFWQHEGFDWYEFKESLERDLEEGKAVRGASTITQQLVKNLYLSSSKNPLRKLKEWILTWYMEQVLSKTRILELYLNLIEWGDGIYGIEAASQYYFGKPASALTREEGARLAAVIPNPRRYRPDSDSRYVVRRATLILHRMEVRGL